MTIATDWIMQMQNKISKGAIVLVLVVCVAAVAATEMRI